MTTIQTKSNRAERRNRFDRLEARISPDQKKLFKQAAALGGQTLTDFIIACASQEAKRIVQQNEILHLSERDRQIFVKALLHPPAPNQALRAAVKRHAKMAGAER